MRRGLSRKRRRLDQGETLLELLITIAVMGTAVVVLLGAIRISVGASTLDRRQVRAQGLLRSWAEYIGDQMTDAAYHDCAGPSTYNATPFDFATFLSATSAAAPPDFMSDVVQVEYWDTTTSPAAYRATASGCTDVGLQRVTLQLTAPDALYPGFVVQQTVVVRKPCDTVNAGGVPTLC